MSVQMEEKLNLKILELLEGKRLSISGLSRELKARGIDEHRLVLTGYLRALRDLEILEETEVPLQRFIPCLKKLRSLYPKKVRNPGPRKFRIREKSIQVSGPSFLISTWISGFLWEYTLSPSYLKGPVSARN